MINVAYMLFSMLLLHGCLELRSLMTVVKIFFHYYKQQVGISYLALSSTKKIEKLTTSINLDKIL